MRANTKSIKPETQIKNLINQAIKKSRDANNGELIGGEFDLSESGLTIKVRIVPYHRYDKPFAIVRHSELGTWNAVLGKEFRVGKPWSDKEWSANDE